MAWHVKLEQKPNRTEPKRNETHLIGAGNIKGMACRHRRTL
jgi:hypothetical protein